MKEFLGIDTSNHTTSTALYSQKKGKIYQYNKNIIVAKKQINLKQNDAVFEHIISLSDTVSTLLEKYEPRLSGVGVSAFLDENSKDDTSLFVGRAVASAVASTHNANCYDFSHREGHIVSALYSLNQMKLLKKDFLVFHISNIASEILLVKPNLKNIMDIEILEKTKNITAGQVVDNLSNLLKLPSPSGKSLEFLALRSAEDFLGKIGNNSDFSFFKLDEKLKDYFTFKMNRYDIAKFCFDSISKAIIEKIEDYKKYNLPIVFCGGVMANSIIKNNIANAFEKENLNFAKKAYATNNAVGIAFLAAMKELVI